MKKVYLDMDGVLCDFQSRYESMFGPLHREERDDKAWSVNWQQFVTTEQFKTLDWFPGGRSLLARLVFLTQRAENLEILSSSGGLEFHEQVKEQKMYWLDKNEVFFKANIVPGRSYKAQYATPDTILIDDTPEIIDAFNAAGGHGILHTDVDQTMALVSEIIRPGRPSA